MTKNELIANTLRRPRRTPQKHCIAWVIVPALLLCGIGFVSGRAYQRANQVHPTPEFVLVPAPAADCETTELLGYDACLRDLDLGYLTGPAPAPQFVRKGKPIKAHASVMCDAGDPYCGKGSACSLPPLIGNGPDKPRRIVPSDHVFASRSGLGIKCGETVELCNPDNGKCTYAKRGTSGPFGACLRPGENPLPGVVPDKKGACNWVIKIKASDPGVWRGDPGFDLTDSVRKAIGHDGWGQVVAHRLRKP